jgi:hypothetical protein
LNSKLNAFSRRKRRTGYPNYQCAVFLFSSCSEFEFQSELDLSRRARVAGGESRIGDLARGRATHHAAGLAKVGLIKDIKELSPELDELILSELR